MRLELKRGSGSIVLSGAGISTTPPTILRHVVSEQWAPAVAPRSTNLLAGDGYATVVERIPLYVRGIASGGVPAPTSAVSLVRSINTWIEDAGNWWRGGAGEPLRVAYRSREPEAWEHLREALVIGPPPGEPAVVLPADYVEMLGQGVIVPVIVQFERRGLWFDPEVVRGAASAGPWQDGSTIEADWFASDDLDTSAARVRLRVDNLPAADSAGVIVLANRAGHVWRRLQSDTATVEDLSPGTAISAAEATALGGNVTLITPSSATPFRWYHPITTAATPARRFAIFLSAMVGAGAVWRIRPVANWRDRGDEAVIWEESADRRRVVACGVVTTTENLWRFGLEIERMSGTGGLVYSHMVAVALDVPGTRVISLPVLSGALIAPRRFEVDPAPLAARGPLVTQLGGTTERLALAVQGDGNLYMVLDSGIGRQDVALVMANRPSAWRWRTGAGTLINITEAEFGRRPARAVAE